MLYIVNKIFSKMSVLIIIACILLLFILLFIFLYFSPFISPYYFKINDLVNNNKIQPIENNTKILNYPLHEFMINTSHNTYLNSIQHASITSCKGIKFALKAGARYIEIDIPSIIFDFPVVAHSNKKYITTSYMKLTNILDCIIKYGLNTSDPLFIDIEMQSLTSDKLNNQIKEIFLNKFGNKLLLPVKDIDFTFLPLKDFLNKVILIKRSNNPSLDGIMHDPYNLLNITEKDPYITKKTINDNIMTRVYLDGSFWSFLSYNIDSNKLRKNYHNLIALNFQKRDKYLYENLLFFKNYSFIHKNDQNIDKYGNNNDAF